MELSDMQARVTELEQQISNLPAGSITKKTVRGKDYFYHRWTENKKRREKYIPADELENFLAQIERRKALEQELKALKKQLPKAKSANLSAFTTNVRTGEALRSFAASVRGYRRRECFRQLHDFVYGEPQDKVFILYGLRRTGKTTMIRQIFAEMSDTELAKAAFIQITAKDTLADVNRDLKLLEAQGFRYVFLDEVTLMEDFIEGAALFSDPPDGNGFPSIQLPRNRFQIFLTFSAHNQSDIRQRVVVDEPIQFGALLHGVRDRVLDGGRIDGKHETIFILDIHAGGVNVELAGYNSSHSDSSLCFGCSFGVSLSSFCRTSFPILPTSASSLLLSFFSS